MATTFHSQSQTPKLVTVYRLFLYQNGWEDDDNNNNYFAVEHTDKTYK